MRLRFFLDQISDKYIRDNFKRLQDAIESEAILKPEFKFFEIQVGAAVTKAAYPHHLTFQPRDVLLVSVTNSADVTFHYDLFTAINIVFTATAACTFRCFIGTYREGVLS